MKKLVLLFLIPSALHGMRTWKDLKVVSQDGNGTVLDASKLFPHRYPRHIRTKLWNEASDETSKENCLLFMTAILEAGQGKEVTEDFGRSQYHDISDVETVLNEIVSREAKAQTEKLEKIKDSLTLLDSAATEDRKQIREINAYVSLLQAERDELKTELAAAKSSLANFEKEKNQSPGLLQQRISAAAERIRELEDQLAQGAQSGLTSIPEGKMLVPVSELAQLLSRNISVEIPYAAKKILEDSEESPSTRGFFLVPRHRYEELIAKEKQYAALQNCVPKDGQVIVTTQELQRNAKEVATLKAQLAALQSQQNQKTEIKNSSSNPWKVATIIGFPTAALSFAAWYKWWACE